MSENREEILANFQVSWKKNTCVDEFGAWVVISFVSSQIIFLCLRLNFCFDKKIFSNNCEKWTLTLNFFVIFLYRASQRLTMLLLPSVIWRKIIGIYWWVIVTRIFVSKFEFWQFFDVFRLQAAVNNVLGSQDVPPVQAPVPMDLENSGGGGDVLMTAPSSPFRNNPTSLFNNAASAFSAFGAGKFLFFVFFASKIEKIEFFDCGEGRFRIWTPIWTVSDKLRVRIPRFE